MSKERKTLGMLPRLVVPVKDLVIVQEALENLEHERALEHVEFIMEHCPEHKEEPDAGDDSSPEG